MEEVNNRVIFDGKLIPAGQPVVPAISRGLMYGDGVFETFRTYRGKTFLLDKHLERLKGGLKFLKTPYPGELDTDKLGSFLHRLLKKQNLLNTDAIVRLQVWREGNRGYEPDREAESHFSITASPCPAKFEPPQLVTVDRKRIPSEALPSAYKFTNGINYILAAEEANQKGGDQALMRTMEGWISETTIANIFWVKNEKIFTPSESCDLIPGISRQVVLEMIEQEDELTIETGEYQIKHIKSANAAWICNSVRELLPVAGINEHSLDSQNSVFTELKKRFKNFRESNLNSL